MSQTKALSTSSFIARVSLVSAVTVLIVLVGNPSRAQETATD
jgi:hypothetical protein